MKAGAGLYRREEIGRSLEGRAIEHVWFGTGATHVLLWSQMHGDEPTATCALLDVLIECLETGRYHSAQTLAQELAARDIFRGFGAKQAIDFFLGAAPIFGGKSVNGQVGYPELHTSADHPAQIFRSGAVPGQAR